MSDANEEQDGDQAWPHPMVATELAVCLTSPRQRWGVPRTGAVGSMSPSLFPHGNSSPLLLSSPIDVSGLHVAQAAGLRAAEQEHVGLEEQTREERALG